MNQKVRKINDLGLEIIGRQSIMEVVKNGKTYEVTETTQKWNIKNKLGIMSISYDVSKKDCATIEELQKYVDETDILN